jgi:ribonuclease P protein component
MAGPFYPAVGLAAAGNSPSATSAQYASASGNASDGTPVQRRATFAKAVRLLKRSEFERVYAAGQRTGCSYFSVLFFHNPMAPEAPARAGLTTPRRLGNAVVRNHLRRRMREAIRLEMHRAAPGWDFVFHPRNAASDVALDRLRAELGKVFDRCR